MSTGLRVRVSDNSWDDIFNAIKSFPKLKSIDLSDCRLSNEIMDDVATLNVESISFTNTDITKDQGAALKEELPYASIEAWHEEFYPGTKVLKVVVLDFEIP